MLLTDLSPLRSFITTDILGQVKLNKYSTGYIYHSIIPTSSSVPYVIVRAIVTRLGKTGKPRIKPVEFCTAPLIYTELIEKQYYTGLEHVLTYMNVCNVTTMENLNFLAWYFANILYMEKMRITTLCPGIFTPTVMKIKRMAADVSMYSKEELQAAVGNVEVRHQLLKHLRLMHSFVRHFLRNTDTYSEGVASTTIIDMATKHIKMVKENNIRETMEGHLELMRTGEKLPKDLLMENMNVSQEYENSGYWV